MTPRRQKLLQQSERRQYVWNIAARLFWLFLFLVHIVPVCIVSARFFQHPSFANMVSLGALYGILTLSALKTLDVAWLRVPLHRRSWLGLLLVAMWIHGDFVARKLPDLITVETTVMIVAGVTAVARRFIRQSHISSAAHLSQLSQAFNYWLEDKVLPQRVLLILPAVSPRAPPVC